MPVDTARLNQLLNLPRSGGPDEAANLTTAADVIKAGDAGAQAVPIIKSKAEQGFQQWLNGNGTLARLFFEQGWDQVAARIRPPAAKQAPVIDLPPVTPATPNPTIAGGQQQTFSLIGDLIGAVGGGTAIGGAIGSIIPGIGTAAGAAIGGFLGGSGGGGGGGAQLPFNPDNPANLSEAELAAALEAIRNQYGPGGLSGGGGNFGGGGAGGSFAPTGDACFSTALAPCAVKPMQQQRLRAPHGYVIVTITPNHPAYSAAVSSGLAMIGPDGAKIAMKKEVARKEGLWRPRRKPLMTGGDMNTIRKANRLRKKAARVAKAAGVPGCRVPK